MPWETSLRDIEMLNNVTHELRQEPGILYPLAGRTIAGNGATEIKIEDTFGKMKLEKKTTRNGDTNYGEVDARRKWIKKPGSSNKALLIDRDDVNSTSVEPKSPLVMEGAAAIRQYHDDQFLKGFWSSRWEGETSGTIEVAFPSANKVGVNVGGNASGMNLPKLIELRRLLGLNNVNFQREQPIILLDADAESNLFAIEEYKSFDYNGSKPLVNGELKPWMGFRFLSANLGSAEAYPESYAFFKPATVNRLPVIIPSNMTRGTWVDAFIRTAPMPDKQWSEQIYAEAESAVTRTEDLKTWFIETQPVAA